METTVKAIPANELDFEEYANLQQEAFRELLKSRGFSEKHLNPTFYKWKFDSPFGKSVISVAFAENRMVSASSITPMKMVYDGLEYRVWQCGDNAALPHLRGGKSNFQGALWSSFMYPTEKSFAYGFPNHNALNIMIKTGCVIKAIAPYYLRPKVFLTKGKFTQSIVNLSSSNDFPEIGHLFNRQDEMNLVKNPQYLIWRYKNNPNNDYKICFSYSASNKVSGLIVTREVSFKSLRLILIMELLAENETISAELLRYAGSLHPGCVVVLAISNLSDNYKLKNGFVKIPDRLTPKKQILVAFNRGFEDRIFNSPITIQTGDWDSF